MGNPLAPAPGAHQGSGWHGSPPRPWLGCVGPPRQQLGHGERGCYGGPTPPFAHHSTMVHHFYGRPGLLLQTALVAAIPHSSPFRLSPHRQHQSSLQVSSKPQVSAPRPLLYQQILVSGCGMQGGGVDCLCMSLSVLPATNQLFCSSPSLCSSLSVPVDLPVRGLPRVQEPSLFYLSLPGAQVPSCFLSPTSFILPSYVKVFLVLSGV